MRSEEDNINYDTLHFVLEGLYKDLPKYFQVEKDEMATLEIPLETACTPLHELKAQRAGMFFKSNRMKIVDLRNHANECATPEKPFTTKMVECLDHYLKKEMQPMLLMLHFHEPNGDCAMIYRVIGHDQGCFNIFGPEEKPEDLLTSPGGSA